MNGVDSEQVFLGTWGELWINGNYMAEATKVRAEVNVKYEEVKRVRKLMNGKKMVGIEGEGEITLQKVSSFMMRKILEDLKKGKAPDATIISKIDDPNAIGAERVALQHCKFSKATLANWERGVQGEETYPFSFEDWDILDKTADN